MGFEMTMEIQRNKDDNTIMQYVIDIRKQESGVMNKAYIERKFRNKMRRVF